MVLSRKRHYPVRSDASSNACVGKNRRGEAVSQAGRGLHRSIPASYVVHTVNHLHPPQLPQSRDELRAWLHEQLNLDADLQLVVFAAIDSVFTRHRQLLEGSKEDEIQALSASFAYKIARLQHELSANEIAVMNISQYLEELVGHLTEKSHRDPRTKLMSFARFIDRCESFISLEQRSQWCAIGLAGIARLDTYDDTYGPEVGDLISKRVGQLLGQRARSDDLHSCFGDDEFCFLIPGLRAPEKAFAIGERFRGVIEEHDWTLDVRELGEQPVRIDVGVTSFRLGQVAERRFIARRLASDLIARAETLMGLAKKDPVSGIRLECMRVRKGELVSMPRRHSA